MSIEQHTPGERAAVRRALESVLAAIDAKYFAAALTPEAPND